MNINIFFFIILFGLTMVYLFFKPMHIKQQKFNDIPLFEISTFNIYELSIKGLSTIMIGSKAIRYSDRYTVSDIDYTDNSKNYIANMKANIGLYKDDVINLRGDVIYTREDGLSFNTQDLTYSKKTSIALTKGNYVSYRDNNKITGTFLWYNNISNRIISKNIIANYNF